MIYIPKFKDIFITDLCMPRVAGRFKFVGHKVDAHGRLDGRSRVIADWFPNMIVDVGLNALGTNTISQMCGQCQLGANGADPEPQQTGMLAYKVTNSSQQGSDSYGKTLNVPVPSTTIVFDYLKRVYRFDASAALTGIIREVGIFKANSTMYSRAQILDANGQPTDIEIFADEVLDVYYEHRLYFDMADHPYSFVMSGVTYNGIARLAYHGGDQSTNSFYKSHSAAAPGRLYMNGSNYNAGFSGDIQGKHQAPAGSSVQMPNTTNNPAASAGAVGVWDYPYTGNLKGSSTIGFGLNDGNLPPNGWKSFLIGWVLGFTQFSLTTPGPLYIPKDVTKVMTLNLEFGPWGRYTPPPP